MTAKEIKAHYKELHDTLSASYYTGTSGLSKEDFDLQHGQIWANMEAELITEGYKQPPTPPRNYGKEIDAIKAEIVKLKVE